MMVDYAFKFANETTAKADATMLAGPFNGLGWLLDHVVAVQVWRPSQDDVAGVHTFLVGFFVVVSIDTPSPIPALFNHAALQFALNRTAREGGQAFVLKNNIGGIITDIAAQPLFEMSNPYPMGGFS